MSTFTGTFQTSFIADLPYFCLIGMGGSDERYRQTMIAVYHTFYPNETPDVLAIPFRGTTHAARKAEFQTIWAASARVIGFPLCDEAKKTATDFMRRASEEMGNTEAVFFSTMVGGEMLYPMFVAKGLPLEELERYNKWMMERGYGGATAPPGGGGGGDAADNGASGGGNA